MGEAKEFRTVAVVRKMDELKNFRKLHTGERHASGARKLESKK